VRFFRDSLFERDLAAESFQPLGATEVFRCFESSSGYQFSQDIFFQVHLLAMNVTSLFLNTKCVVTVQYVSDKASKV